MGWVTKNPVGEGGKEEDQSHCEADWLGILAVMVSFPRAMPSEMPHAIW